MDKQYAVALAIIGAALLSIMIMVSLQDAEGQDEPLRFTGDYRAHEKIPLVVTNHISGAGGYHMLWDPHNNQTFHYAEYNVEPIRWNNWSILPTPSDLYYSFHLGEGLDIPLVDNSTEYHDFHVAPYHVTLFTHQESRITELNATVTELKAQIDDLTYQVDKLKKLSKK